MLRSSQSLTPVLDLVGAYVSADLAEAHPGRSAALDQHTSALRDSLGQVSSAVAEDYCRGFLSAALERGWRPAGGADWESLRLTALLLLARSEGAAGR